MLQGEGRCSPGLWEREREELSVKGAAENPGSSHMSGGTSGEGAQL